MPNLPLPRLYSFRRCPYAIRARLALRYSGIELETVEVDLKQKPVEMLALSPKGTVPVLQLPDESVLDESLDIMHWALAVHDPDGWLDVTTAGNTLIRQNDEQFKPALDRYKYAVRFPEKSQQDYRQEAESFLHLLETKLAGQPCLDGNRITLVDMAIMPFVRQFAFVDRRWFDSAPYPNVRMWLNQLLESPLFEQVMKKIPEQPSP